jgi:hypothetical protein
VLCCSNMSGTNKRKLLVTGKCVKEWCLKGMCMDSLQVLHYARKCVDDIYIIFKKWLMNWGVELQQKLSRFLLVIDNYAARPHLHFLRNIQLEFQSPETTSLVQLMDTGIITF